VTGLVVDIVDLPRATGSVKNLQIRTPAPADLGTEVIGVPEGSDLALDVTLTSMDDGVLAQADADQPSRPRRPDERPDGRPDAVAASSTA